MKAQFFTEQIFSHQAVYEHLIQASSEARPQQSFIFAGPDGIGKKTVALRFARHLLCDRNIAGGCGTCASCRFFDKPWSWHPDLIFFQRFEEPVLIPHSELDPYVDHDRGTIEQLLQQLVDDDWIAGHHNCSQAGSGFEAVSLIKDLVYEKNAQKPLPVRTRLEKELEKLAQTDTRLPELVQYIYSSISPYTYSGTLKVDAIRQALILKVGEKPFLSHRRVFILDGADTMTTEAQNALLKTLEEPPYATVIILITAKRNILLPTVKSRCRMLMFTPLEHTGLTALVRALTDLPEPEAGFRARAAHGDVLKALMIDPKAYSIQRQQMLNILKHFNHYTCADLTADQAMLTQDLARSNHELYITSMQILESLISDIQYILSHDHRKQTDHILVHEDIRAELETIAQKFSFEDIAYLAHEFQKLDRRHHSHVVDQWNIITFLQNINLHFNGRKHR
ncbi:hypothetical protein JXQ70_13480 [bacterium]|nr:hypothetical protein [bacterium]